MYTCAFMYGGMHNLHTALICSYRYWQSSGYAQLSIVHIVFLHVYILFNAVMYYAHVCLYMYVVVWWLSVGLGFHPCLD